MRIYLAGPDVFRPDARAWGEAARARLAAAGHRALLPFDNEASTAAAICAANLALIGEADAVLANLNAFRGAEPDSGTCFEVGYALALGKRVVAYLDDIRPQVDKLAAHYGAALARREGRPVDPQGLAVEDFALPLNLMLAVSCEVVAGGLEQALARLAD